MVKKDKSRYFPRFVDSAEDTLAREVAARLKELDTNAYAVEKASFLPADAVRSILRGNKKSGTTLNRAKDVCEALGLELYIGPPRHDPIGDAVRGMAERLTAEDFAFVDRFDVKLSAGPGATGDNARKLAAVAFRKDWLSDRGLNPSSCVVCSVGGNSMEPLLYEGDLVLLDRHRRELRNGLVYGITDIEGDVRIKRIERVEQGIILRSDNPECPSELRLGEDANRVKIIGALAWSGHNHDTLKQLPKRSQQPPTFEHEWV
jgi:phage repressor protein C with HTH and peptisase S24 domain